MTDDQQPPAPQDQPRPTSGPPPVSPVFGHPGQQPSPPAPPGQGTERQASGWPPYGTPGPGQPYPPHQYAPQPYPQPYQAHPYQAHPYQQQPPASGLYVAAAVLNWVILGFITLATCGLGLVAAAWFVPMTISIHKASRDRYKHTALGVCTLLFCGLIPGILMLIDEGNRVDRRLV